MNKLHQTIKVPGYSIRLSRTTRCAVIFKARRVRGIALDGLEYGYLLGVLDRFPNHYGDGRVSHHKTQMLGKAIGQMYAYYAGQLNRLSR